MNPGALVGKKAIVISSAHSSRYGYVGSTTVAGTVLAAGDVLQVLIEEGRFRGNTWEVPLREASIERCTAESYALKGEGAWAGDTEISVANPDVVIRWEQWQPE